MAFLVPDAALHWGLMNDPVGTHGSRTIMLRELRQLLGADVAGGDLDAYRDAVVGGNVLQKATVTTRKESFRRLRELYGLTQEVLLFRALHDLWAADELGQPLIALLCACARDPILRETAPLIVRIPEGETVLPQQISEAARQAFPDRYNPTMLANIGRHAASSWQQSGHLRGRLRKTRARAESRPTALAYALLLGHLCDVRGDALFSTLWCRLLDAPIHLMREQAQTASRQGWIEYRSGGGVTEVGFRHLLRDIDV